MINNEKPFEHLIILTKTFKNYLKTTSTKQSNTCRTTNKNNKKA